jgi:hypothetical protein
MRQTTDSRHREPAARTVRAALNMCMMCICISSSREWRVSM